MELCAGLANSNKEDHGLNRYHEYNFVIGESCFVIPNIRVIRGGIFPLRNSFIRVHSCEFVVKRTKQKSFSHHQQFNDLTFQPCNLFTCHEVTEPA
jgi:hypothetical protein